MPRNIFIIPALRVAFALLLPLAPMAAAQDTSAVTAGAGLYGSAEEEAEELRQRAEEFEAKESALRLQARNDKVEAGRLEPRAGQRRADAKRLEARAEQAEGKGAEEEAERFEAAAEQAEAEADELDDKAEDFRDSAEEAEEGADAAAEQAARNRQLGDAIARMAGRWECRYKWDGKNWLEKTEDNQKDIDVDASKRHGMIHERFDIFSDYSYAGQKDTRAEYVFLRERELWDESYEFRIQAARPYSEKNGGNWKVFRKEGKGEAHITFAAERLLFEIGELETVAQSVELDPFLGRNKPVRNWESVPAAESEMRSMEEDVGVIFFPPASRYESPDGISAGVVGRSFFWWEEHCAKIE